MHFYKVRDVIEIDKNYLYGFDLSLSETGYTIFDLTTLSPVLVGSIKTKDKDTHGVRLKKIYDHLIELREQYPPKLIAIERGFSQFNTSTAVLYRVHGITNLAFHDVEQIYYPPKKVKESIISGKATKEQVRKRVVQSYPIVFDNLDESDSFAVALTYLIENDLIPWEKGK